MKTIDNLQWRYATKKFDSEKKVALDEINQLKEVIRLSPTSYGLQLFKILDIQDSDIRKKLQPESWGQSQIVDASHLFVFAVKNKISDDDVENYVNLKAEKHGMNPEDLKVYSDFAKGKLQEIPSDFYSQWTAKQAYIALGNLITAAAELHIDVCPMEGFDSVKYDEILGLKGGNYASAVVAAIGYRSSEDPTQNGPKIRKSTEDLVEII